MSGWHIRMRRLFAADGRAVVVALDHGQHKGNLPGLSPFRETIRQVVEAGADGLILNPGAMRMGVEVCDRNVSLILRVTGASTDRDPCFDYHRLILPVEDAVAAGADAVIAMAFVGGKGEAPSLAQLARVASACRRWGMPLIAEMLMSVPERFHDLEWIEPATRVAYELGADVVKVYGASEEGFDKLVRECPVPVLAAGGPGGDDPIALARKVIASGAAGVAFGRSVFGSHDPGTVVRRLVEVVHGVKGGAHVDR